jgi:hypothetical protein
MQEAPVTQTGENGAMIHHFLYGLITHKGLVKAITDPAVFIINGEFTGLCFLRTIISKAQLNRVGTVDMIQNRSSRRIQRSYLDGKCGKRLQMAFQRSWYTEAYIREHGKQRNSSTKGDGRIQQLRNHCTESHPIR